MTNHKAGARDFERLPSWWLFAPSESGSKLTALQTLRDNQRAIVFAKRLECEELAPALAFARGLSESRKGESIRNPSPKKCMTRSHESVTFGKCQNSRPRALPWAFTGRPFGAEGGGGE